MADIVPSSDDIPEGEGAKPFLNEYRRTLRPDAGADLVLKDDGKIIITLTDEQTATIQKLLKEHGDPQMGLRPPPTPTMPPYPTETINALRGMIDDLIFHIERSPCVCDACQNQYADDGEKLLKEIRGKL